MLCSKQASLDVEFLTAFVACNSVHSINARQSMQPCCAFETEGKKSNSEKQLRIDMSSVENH